MQTRENRSHRATRTQQQPFFQGQKDAHFFSEGKFFSSLGIQPKLTIGQPGDKYEREADAMADRVVNHSASTNTQTPSIQPMCPECEQEEMVNRMPKRDYPEGFVDDEDQMYQSPIQMQTQSNAAATASPQLSSQLNQAQGSGQTLPKSTRGEMESAFGTDFQGVRIHTNQQAIQMNQELGAQAFTHGKDVYFNSGKYQPESTEGKRLLAHELTHVVQQGSKTYPRVQTFRRTSVRAVRSLTMEDWSSNRIPNSWSGVRARMRRRDHLISERLRLVRSGSNDHTVLTRLTTRWPSLKRLLANSSFDPATGRLPSDRALDVAVRDETTDKSALRGRSNRFVRGVIEEFLNTLRAYRRMRDTFDDERGQFHRLDRVFQGRNVQTLLRAIPNVSFNSADLKALIGTETADLTNTSVDGINRRKSGIRTARTNRGGHIGLGQHTTGARDEAIEWARRHGVVIPRRPDPRRSANTSILLTAAFLGRVMDLVFPRLPNHKPSRDELKKMIIAAYNGGHVGVIRAANHFVAGRTVRYTWNDIRNRPGITGQMRNYVRDTTLRLS